MAISAPKQNHSAEQTKLDSCIAHALEEARMIIPGVQALFGFQLIAVFSETFANLPRIDQVVHFIAILLSALSITLLLSPAAYHRIINPRVIWEDLLQVSSIYITAGMVPLMLSLCLDTYIIAYMIFGHVLTSASSAFVLLAVMCVFWFVIPLASKKSI